jgi:glycosyltransferase involved in cell wall biosynthesis
MDFRFGRAAMKKTTLTLTAPLFYPELTGAFRQYFHYAPGLLERGVEMCVFTLTRQGESPGLSVINGIKVFRENLSHPIESIERQLLLGPALNHAVTQRAGSPQVIVPLGINWAMARALWKAQQKGVATAAYITTAPELPEDPLAAIRVRLSQSILLSIIDRLVFCSTAQIELFRRTHWIPSRKCLTIPNGVRTDRFRPATELEREQLRHQLGLDPDELLFCFVGNIVERKGVDLLVRAWRGVQAQHPNARLLLIGQRTMPATFRTPELHAQHAAFEARLEAALAALDPRARPVLFQPPTEQIEDWLRASDAFVFPSLCEGLPNALLEAMACGLPAIVGPFAGLPHDGEELGRQGSEFILAPHDEQAWTDAINTLAASPRRRAEVGQAGHRWVARYHDYSHVLDQLAEHYHQTAAARWS